MQSYYTKVRDIIANNSPIYTTLCRIHPKKRKLVVSKRTKIVIEGFPRCANTWTVVAFAETQANIREYDIAHHLHAPAQVHFALKHKIPCVVLIRNPLDAVKSLSVRTSHNNTEHIFKRYYKFYNSIIYQRDKFVICDFNEAVNEFPRLIEKVNSVFGTTYSAPTMTNDLRSRIFKRIEYINKDEDSMGIKGIAIPDPEKSVALNEIKLLNGEWQQRASGIYSKMVELK